MVKNMLVILGDDGMINEKKSFIEGGIPNLDVISEMINIGIINKIDHPFFFGSDKSFADADEVLEITVRRITPGSLISDDK